MISGMTVGFANVMQPTSTALAPTIRKRNASSAEAMPPMPTPGMCTARHT